MAPCRSIGRILAVLSLVALSNAGPLGPLPNVTSSDVGLKEGSCVLGDVVYMPGDTFTGATPCERCACAAGSVQCAQERCEPRPGCKALHRPDHCCPTYQCECEQEGRVYGNGEKLVDPEDPCRVCYCQGGEVVCRRIACFLRDDCEPRLVPGRCCPEYDNCPLRGITAIPGLVPPVSTITTTKNVASAPAPIPPKENIRQEITIKEITPVSEIPIITDVKIKEILPSPSIEVPEYPSSKSPLIPREAIPDKTVTTSSEVSPKTEESVLIELISPLPTEQSSKTVEKILETKSTADLLPSKISLSTQDSINSEIYPSHIPTIIATMGDSPPTLNSVPAASTNRVAITEEEDTLFDHNPAFPPIPDDVSLPGTHEDELLSEQNADGDHANVHGEQHIASSLPPASTTIVPREVSTTTAFTTTTTPTTTELRPLTEATSTTTPTTTELRPLTEATSTTTFRPEVETTAVFVLTSTTMQNEAQKGSPMLDPRTAIPEKILNTPSSLPEDITGDLDDPEEYVTVFEEPPKVVLKWSGEVTSTPNDVTQTTSTITSTTTGTVTRTTQLQEETTVAPQVVTKKKVLPRSSEVTSTPNDVTQTTVTVTLATTEPVTRTTQLKEKTTKPRSNEITVTPFDKTTRTTQKITEAPEVFTSTTRALEELTTGTVSKSYIATEITAQTEFSSLPIETSDQNPHDSSESLPKEKSLSTTEASLLAEFTRAKATTESQEVSFTKATSTTTSTPEIQSYENLDTTDFVPTAFGSSESVTDFAELIKVPTTHEVKNAAIIDSSHGKKYNVLNDLRDLVGDVASISDHADERKGTLRTTTSNSYPDSEELMPYKSKNSNFNLNSITEVPLKTKNQPSVNKQKVVEIEGEDTDSIADAPPPHDKVEPTTRRPIIDNVSDSIPKNETEKKDIEIISQSYVPTIRRPTKVVMKKNNDKPLSEVTTEGTTLATATSDMVTSSSDLVTSYQEEFKGSPIIVTDNAQSSDESTSTADPTATVGTEVTTTTAPQ